MRIATAFGCCVLLLTAAPGCFGEDFPYFIPGSAVLPECTEAPAYDIDGSYWADSGTVTIESTGCAGTMPGQEFPSCSLGWELTQSGAEIEILVDYEYRILGRLCGDVLYLRGGWWLPVEDEDLMQCTYSEDSAEEVGIAAGGSSLVIAPQEYSDLLIATGTLKVEGPCDASYEMELRQFR